MSELLLRRNLTYLCAVGFYLKLVSSFGVILGFSAFIKNSGVGNMPYYYIVFNLFIAVLGVFLFFKKNKNFNMFYYLTPAMGLIFIAYSFLPEQFRNQGSFMLYTIISLFDIYAGIFFWNHVNNTLTVKELKKYIGIISGLSLLGSIIIGFLNKGLVEVIPINQCQTICGFLFLLFPLLILLKVPLPAHQEINQTRGVLSGIFNHKLVKVLFFMMITAAFIKYTLGYEYSYSLSKLFTNEKDLAGFFGILDASLKILTFLCQITLSRQILNRCSIASAISINTFSTIFISAIALSYESAIIIIIFQFVYNIFAKVADTTSINTLYNVFHGNLRDNVRYFLEGIVYPVTVIFTGIFIALFKSYNQVLIFACFVMAVFLLIVLRYVNSAYIEMVSSNLETGGNCKDIFLEYDFNTSQSIDYEKMIASENVKDKLTAIKYLGEIETEDAKKLLIKFLHKEKSLILISTGIKALSIYKGESCVKTITDFLFNSHDSRVIANSIEALVNINHHGSLNDITKFLTHENNRVRANASLAILKLSCDEYYIRLAVDSIISMLKSDEPEMRVSALMVMGQIGLKCFFNPILNAFYDSEIKVRNAAFIAACKTGDQRFLGHLKTFAFSENDPDIKSDISNCIDKLESGSEKFIYNLLKKYSTEERQKIIKYIGNKQHFEFITDLLKVENCIFTSKQIVIISKFNDKETSFKKLKECFFNNEFDPLSLFTFISQTKCKDERLMEFISETSGLNPDFMASKLFDAIKITDNIQDRIYEIFNMCALLSNEKEKCELIYNNLLSKNLRKQDLASELIMSIKTDEIKNALLYVYERVRNYTGT